MMPYVGGKLQAGGPPPHSRRSSSGNVVYFGQHFISSLKPLSTSGSAPCPPCAVCLFFKPDYAKDPDAHSTKTALDWYE